MADLNPTDPCPVCGHPVNRHRDGVCERGIGIEPSCYDCLANINLMLKVDGVCTPCGGSGWVCEDHHTVPWGDGDNCCGAPGMPCLVCNGGDTARFPAGSIPLWDFKNDPPGPRVWSQKEVNDFSEPRGAYHFSRPHSGDVEAEIEKLREAGLVGGTYEFEASVLDYEEPMDIAEYQGNWQHTDHADIVNIEWSSAAKPVSKESIRESVDRAMREIYHDLGIQPPKE
jgi:hypothetical protein